MTRRHWAIGIVAAWALSLGWLVKREYFRATGARLAEAALSVPPGAMYYRIDLGGQQVGFTSATLDTLADAIRVEDVLVVDIPALGRVHRNTARSVAFLSRALRLDRLDAKFDNDLGQYTTRGEVRGDSVLRLAIVPGTSRDSQVARFPIGGVGGAVTLPTLLPLRLAFGGELTAGREYSIGLFDPFLMAERQVTVHVAAESTLVVADSAVLDSTTMVWVPVHVDTVRAFRIDQTTPGAGDVWRLSAWIDAQGRVVRASTPAGFTIERTAFELAYENFRRRDTVRVARATATPEPGDVIATTAIGAGASLRATPRAELRVRLSGVPLPGFDFGPGGATQTLTGDTLRMVRAAPALLRASYHLPARDTAFARWLVPEPMLQARDGRIGNQAFQIVGRERDPAKVAELITHWVYGTVRKERIIAVPNAVQVLASRRGDCNEHTALFIALARAAGLPARSAAGLVYLNDRFYYHAWPEVYLGDWVPVDPTLDQFPADAGHLRFTVGGFARDIELVRLIGRLRPEVL